MSKITPAQRQYIRKRTNVAEPDPSEMAGELNIVPFLDITVNLIMFLLMLTTTIAFFAQIEARLPEYSRGGVGKRSQNESLNLNITVTDNGVIVTGSGGKLAPGCETTGSGRVVTVPKTGSEYDWAGLTQCASRVKKEFPDEETVTVTADSLIQLEHVVKAMDSMRNDGDEKLFPKVMLSAGMR